MIQECARTMLLDSKLPRNLCAEAVATTCYILYRILISHLTNKTPYELLFNNKPKVSYFKVFGSKCFILNIKDNLDNLILDLTKESLSDILLEVKHTEFSIKKLTPLKKQ